MTINTVRGAAASAMIMSLLVLTACGGGGARGAGSDAKNSSPNDNSESGWTYQFDEAKVADPGDADPMTAGSNPFTVTLSDELKKASPDAGTLAVNSYQVTTKALPSGLCRMDAKVAFAPGGAQAITKDGGAASAYGLMGGNKNNVEVISAIPDDDSVSSDGGDYITKDASQFATVDDCSDENRFGAMNSFTDLEFPYAEPISGLSDKTGSTEHETSLAEVELVLVAGGQSGAEGSTALLKGETILDVSAGGTWKKPTEPWAIDNS